MMDEGESVLVAANTGPRCGTSGGGGGGGGGGSGGGGGGTVGRGSRDDVVTPDSSFCQLTTVEGLVASGGSRRGAKGTRNPPLIDSGRNVPLHAKSGAAANSASTSEGAGTCCNESTVRGKAGTSSICILHELCGDETLAGDAEGLIE